MMNSEKPVDMLDVWRQSARYWTKYSDIIAKMFAPLTEAMIERAGIHEGHSVLDVAGGAGEPSLTIAERVGPGGSVTCTDAVAEMVEAARSEANRRGLKNVQFQQCTADSLPFPDNSFDVVVSRLGAMFFPDAVGSMREMLRVAKPGGSLTFAVWYKSDVNPFCYLVSNVMDQHVKAAPDPAAPNAFRFAEPGKLAGVMKQAGVTDIGEEVVSLPRGTTHSAGVLDHALSNVRHASRKARKTACYRADSNRNGSSAGCQRVLPSRSDEVPDADAHRHGTQGKLTITT